MLETHCSPLHGFVNRSRQIFVAERHLQTTAASSATYDKGTPVERSVRRAKGLEQKPRQPDRRIGIGSVKPIYALGSFV